MMFIFTHQKVGYGLLPQVAQCLAEVDDEGVVGPESSLDYGPVGHPPVTGHGVEIQISVQVVRGPLYLHNTSSHLVHFNDRGNMSRKKHGWSIMIPVF